MGKQTVVVAITEEGDGKFIVGVLRAMFDCDPAHVTELFPGHPDSAELMERAADALTDEAGNSYVGSHEGSPRWKRGETSECHSEILRAAAKVLRGKDGSDE